MILTKEQMGDRRTYGASSRTQDLIDTIESAWKERDEAVGRLNESLVLINKAARIEEGLWKEHTVLRIERNNLAQQNAELLEDVAALRLECDALKRQLAEAPHNECRWTERENGPWETGCGEAFEFLDGGPAENDQRYCGYCGGKLIAVPYVESVEEPQP